VIRILRDGVTLQDVNELLEEWGSFIKLAVDIRTGDVAAGGEMHADCEVELLEQGSRQEDIWGADWVPEESAIRFESLINIRPTLGNRSTTVLDPAIRAAIEAIVRRVFDK
jgi:hypothetical protein